MATRKRRSTKRRRVHARRNPVNPVNPTRRRRRSTRRRHTVHARRHNPVNPTHRRRRRIGRRRHHRNPFRGAGGEILNYTVAGLGLGIVTPMVARFAGGFLPFGQYNAPIISAGSGWLLSKVFEMFGFTRRFAHPTFVFGVAAGAMQVLQPIVARTIAGVGGAANPTGMGARYRRPGMAGIGVMTGIPPNMALPPLANNQSMQGIGMRPGTYAN